MNAWKKRLVELCKMTKDDAARLYKMHCREFGLFGGTDDLARRARLKAKLADCSEDGMIAVVTAGMDCDCVRYRRVKYIPTPTVMEWVSRENDEHRYADGPVNMYIARPSDEPEGHVSHDLALEAFENGHQHVVYA